jgi:hypothetical protein
VKKLSVLISLLFLIVMWVRFTRAFQSDTLTLYMFEQELLPDSSVLNGSIESSLRNTGYGTN